MDLINATNRHAGFTKNERLGTAEQAGPQFSDAGKMEHSARQLRTLLCLSASPISGAMAIVTTLSPGIDLCSTAGGLLPFGGMTWMYALMCLFHLEAWLKRYAESPRSR